VKLADLMASIAANEPHQSQGGCWTTPKWLPGAELVARGAENFGTGRELRAEDHSATEAAIIRVREAAPAGEPQIFSWQMPSQCVASFPCS
jgi:hypothetical protein